MAKQSVRIDRMGFDPDLKTPHTKLKGLTPDFGVDSALNPWQSKVFGWTEWV
jgi:hypothetical protein